MQVKMLECFKRSSVMSLPVYALYLQTLLFNFTNTKLNHKRNSLRERGKRGRREREGETERGREMERKKYYYHIFVRRNFLFNTMH